MEGLILNGEEWMYPFLNLRDELVDGRNIRENREIFRRYRRFKVSKNEVAKKTAKIEENSED